MDNRVILEFSFILLPSSRAIDHNKKGKTPRKKNDYCNKPKKTNPTPTKQRQTSRVNLKKTKMATALSSATSSPTKLSNEILNSEPLEKDDLEKSIRKSLAGLDVQRKALETESQAIYLELTTPPAEGIKPMGVDDPLVDQDGFPRGDIDIYRARTLRQRFHVIQTDHKELLRRIEELLTKLAAIKVGTIFLTLKLKLDAN